ncbi:metalloprotease TldD [Niveispirillum sp. BGYR6]|uniref:metalloprotease TldD n=1 Tax=Niveispirillum sp. BGYR6 TaxID=2971249 RepID=UPI0022B9584D|nr:metalloprotease TldD [Niveispirillum sp. BGYR6]MDG5497534.1 metalloprotease TldD [Niveispirillum sp. BGYR6]
MLISSCNDVIAHARQVLLTPEGLDLDSLGRTLEAMSGKGIDHADLYFESGSQEDWMLQEGRVTRGAFSITRGVGARTIAGEKVGFAYASDLTPRALQALVEANRSMIRLGRDASEAGGVDLSAGPRGGGAAYPPVAAGGGLESPARIALLRRLDGLARAADPRIRQVMARLSVTDTLVLIAASDGTLAADIRPLIEINMSVLAEAGGRRANGSASLGGRMALSAVTEENLSAMADRATRMALTLLDARPAPAGEMPVVLGPGFPGVLLHEAVGHGLEGDAHRKRSSVFASMMGEMIAHPSVTVMDDATVAGARGALNIDDEGTPGARNLLIDKGRLVGLMQDRMNARLLGVGVTGNGRRQSYADLPMPRMTNTYLQAGQHDPQEIIASVGNGLYAVSFGGGTVDITSGQFNFTATEAYLIEDGKVTAPVMGATLIGMGHEALRHVSMTGHDLALDAGICIKAGQQLPVCVGQPTVRIDRMLVGGAR